MAGCLYIQYTEVTIALQETLEEAWVFKVTNKVVFTLVASLT